MFAPRYFAERYFAGRYFAQGVLGGGAAFADLAGSAAGVAAVACSIKGRSRLAGAAAGSAAATATLAAIVPIGGLASGAATASGALSTGTVAPPALGGGGWFVLAPKPAGRFVDVFGVARGTSAARGTLEGAEGAPSSAAQSPRQTLFALLAGSADAHAGAVARIAAVATSAGAARCDARASAAAAVDDAAEAFVVMLLAA
jgi:hypothetical protein